MPTTTNLSQLTIHKMTSAQYESATKNANDLYFLSDYDGYLRTYVKNTDKANLNTVGTGNWLYSHYLTEGTATTITKPSNSSNNAWSILNIQGHKGNWSGQLFFDQAAARLHYRVSAGTSTFGNWNQIAYTSDIPTAGVDYLPISGGTLTGILNVQPTTNGVFLTVGGAGCGSNGNTGIVQFLNNKTGNGAGGLTFRVNNNDYSILSNTGTNSSGADKALILTAGINTVHSYLCLQSDKCYYVKDTDNSSWYTNCTAAQEIITKGDLANSTVAGANLTTTQNALAYYTNTTGTFGNSAVTLVNPTATYTDTGTNNPSISFGGYGGLTANNAGAFVLMAKGSESSMSSAYLVDRTTFRPVSGLAKIVSLGTTAYPWKAINTTKSSSANDVAYGINFGDGTTQYGHIGASTGLGLYSAGNLYLRAGNVAGTTGTTLTTTSFYPSLNSSSQPVYSLGTSDNKWKDAYIVTIYGNLTGNVTGYADNISGVEDVLIGWGTSGFTGYSRDIIFGTAKAPTAINHSRMKIGSYLDTNNPSLYCSYSTNDGSTWTSLASIDPNGLSCNLASTTTFNNKTIVTTDMLSSYLDSSALSTAINRTTAVNVADTNYTTYMARGVAMYPLNSSSVPTVNGTIAWYYE